MLADFLVRHLAATEQADEQHLVAFGQEVARGADATAAERLRTLLADTSSVAGATEEAAATGTGWGTLTGRFVFAGTPGDAKALVVDKDTEVCSKDGMRLMDRSLLVDPSSKGLANVVVFARKVSRVKDATPPETQLVFDQKQCEFITPVFAARVGQPIDVRNSDPVGHNTNIAGTSFNPPSSWLSGAVGRAFTAGGSPKVWIGKFACHGLSR